LRIIDIEVIPSMRQSMRCRDFNISLSEYFFIRYFKWQKYYIFYSYFIII